MARKPYAETKLAKYIEKRTLELRPGKSQAQIAEEAGFVNPNMIAMLKSGASKLALDRVVALAKALECDPRLLFKLALEQQGGTPARAVEEIFGKVRRGRAAPVIASRSREEPSPNPMSTISPFR